jgi:hypothetical protein
MLSDVTTAFKLKIKTERHFHVNVFLRLQVINYFKKRGRIMYRSSKTQIEEKAIKCPKQNHLTTRVVFISPRMVADVCRVIVYIRRWSLPEYGSPLMITRISLIEEKGTHNCKATEPTHAAKSEYICYGAFTEG